MTSNAALHSASRPAGVRIAAALAGALLVAGAAQVAIPIPGTPVPFTLQPLAVLVVGGLLGARLGALSLAGYLAMGAAGLPVFTPFGAPGLARLFGPTGGYLLAYPLAAAVVGGTLGRRRAGPARGAAGGEPASPPSRPTAFPPYRLTALAALAGMAVIYAGGAAQLAVLRMPVAAGVAPFAAADLAKVLLAALIVRRFHPLTRALV